MQCNEQYVKNRRKKCGIIKSSAAIFANYFSNGTTFFEIEPVYFLQFLKKI